jgi:hypothetical protein
MNVLRVETAIFSAFKYTPRACQKECYLTESGSGEVSADFFAVVMAFLGDPGFVEAAMAATFGLDFFGRENEPGSYRFVICFSSVRPTFC